MKTQEQIVDKYGIVYWRIHFEEISDLPLTQQQYETIQETITDAIHLIHKQNNYTTIFTTD